MKLRNICRDDSLMVSPNVLNANSRPIHYSGSALDIDMIRVQSHGGMMSALPNGEKSTPSLRI